MDDDQPRDVAPNDALLRRVINRADFLEWHADWGRWIPSAGAVKFDPDGMSAFVERFLQERGQGAAAVGTAGGTKAPEPVFAVRADHARALDFGVAHTRDDRSSIGYAHASVTRPEGQSTGDFKSARSQLAQSMTLVHGTITVEPPDGA